jgi:S-adenosylmethionine hydrolase
MSSPIITLTSDFGSSGAYVSTLKGVVLGLNPKVALVDISHEIPPQNVAHGAFVLGSAYKYFPSDTVHVAVVDPGVGSSRRALLLLTEWGRFLAPDNGLLTYVLMDGRLKGFADDLLGPDKGEFLSPVTAPVPDGCSVFSLTRPEFWLQPVSDTFHGRDVFAPVAAHLSRGVTPERLGDPVDEVLRLNIWQPESRDGIVRGRIIFVDHFGNLVSNILSSDVPAGSVDMEIGGTRISGLSRFFAEGTGVMALIGSHGYLEIAKRDGSAADQLKAGVGEEVRVAKAGRAMRP